MTNRIKILHIINGEFFAGAERVQDLLGLNLPDLGVELVFVSIKPKDFKNSRQSVDIPLYEFEMKSRFDLRVAFKINKIIKEADFQLIHTHTPRSALIGCLVSILSGLPMIHHVHSPTDEDTENYFRNKLNVIINKISLSKVNQFIAVSNTMKDYLVNKGYPEKIVTVVHNGVPIPKEQYILNNTPWIISCVAYFRPRKGLEILIHALAEVNKKYSVELHVIGAFESSYYENQVTSLVHELELSDKIQWIGFTNDVLGELEKTNLFVLPSLYGEGLPMVIIEAMSIGLPVVSTRIEGIPETIQDGVEGYLVPAGNSSELAKSIIRVISDKEHWKMLSKRSLKRHREKFSDISMSKKVLCVYNHVLYKSK